MNEPNQPVPAQYVRPVRSRRGWIIVAIIVFLFLCLCSGCGLLWYLAATASNGSGSALNLNGQSYDNIYGDSKSSNKILSIPINGVIMNTKSDVSGLSLLTTTDTFGYDIKQTLEAAAADSSIKAVILEIDSPGGTITGAKAISDGVADFRAKSGKPVYAHIMGMGASGAYWSAASTDYIFADYGSLVGSIGVILGPFDNYQNVTTLSSGTDSVTAKDGITQYYITAGGYKDIGNPFRPMSSTETNTLQTGTDQAYATFVDFVSKQRNIQADTIRNQIQALPYSETQALSLKLIDKIGSREDAYSALAVKAGISGDYQVVSTHVSNDIWSLLFSGELLTKNTYNAADRQADYCTVLCGKMLYLYGDPQTLK